MKESITHLQAFITELVNEAVQVALEQHQETAITELAENNLKSEILNADQAAEFLHIAKQTLYSMTSRRKIPFYKNGKKMDKLEFVETKMPFLDDENHVLFGKKNNYEPLFYRGDTIVIQSFPIAYQDNYFIKKKPMEK